MLNERPIGNRKSSIILKSIKFNQFFSQSKADQLFLLVFEPYLKCMYKTTNKT